MSVPRWMLEQRLRESLEIAAEEEAERFRARAACPPHPVLRAACRLLNESLERLERWTGDRCLERYRRMRR
jgi:hypothetical protein